MDFNETLQRMNENLASVEALIQRPGLVADQFVVVFRSEQSKSLSFLNIVDANKNLFNRAGDALTTPRYNLAKIKKVVACLEGAESMPLMDALVHERDLLAGIVQELPALIAAQK